MNRCSTCKTFKESSAFWPSDPLKCKACKSAYSRRYHLRTYEVRKPYFRRARLKKYGLTVEAYEAMLAGQQRVCKIFKLSDTTGRLLAVDHCHKTGKIRGLLCTNCNVRLLPAIEEFPHLIEIATNYLKEK